MPPLSAWRIRAAARRVLRSIARPKPPRAEANSPDAQPTSDGARHQFWRRAARRRRLPLGHPVRPGPSRLPGRHLDAASPSQAVALGVGALRAAHVRRLRRLPPLLLAPRVQDQPRRPVRARLPRPELGAARRAVVGGQAPLAPPALRHRAGRPLARASTASSTPIVGWIFAAPARRDRPRRWSRDLAKYPELRLARPASLPDRDPAGRAARFLLAGWPGLVVGFFWSTVAALARHVLHQLAGARARHAGATSPATTRRNNWWLAIVTLGEGWHNNHHAYQASARQGFRWWQYDPTFYALQGAVLAAAWSGTSTSPPPAWCAASSASAAR